MQSCLVFFLLLAVVLLCTAEDNVCVKPEELTSLEKKYLQEKEDLAGKITALESQLRQSLENAQASAEAGEERTRQMLDEASEVLKDRNAKLNEIEKLKQNLATSAQQVSEFQHNLKAATEQNELHLQKIQSLKQSSSSGGGADAGQEQQLRNMEQQLSQLQEELAAAQRSLNLDVWLSETYDVALEQFTHHMTRAYIISSRFAVQAQKHAHLFLKQTVKPQLRAWSKVAQQAYDTHCKEAMTPLLEEAQPHLNKYLPLATQQVDEASALVFQFADTLHGRFQLGRELLKEKAQDIAGLDQRKASIAVDLSLGAMLAPLILFVLPKIWALVWFAIGLSCCCFCCGCCRRKKAKSLAKNDTTGTTPMGKISKKAGKKGRKGK